MANLSIPERIECGYGDYVVYRIKDGGESENIDLDSYNKIYTEIFLPATKPIKDPQSAMDQYAVFKKEIEQLDPTLKIVFVPRILSELKYIHCCIQEDMDAESICPFTSRRGWTSSPEGQKKNHILRLADDREQRKCWHAGCFKDKANAKNPEMTGLAHRFNGMLIDELQPKGGSFTYSELLEFLQKEIAYLENHNSKQHRVEGFSRSEMGASGPTVNFCYESAHGDRVPATPLGIHDHTHSKIIRNALALECSRLAQNSSHILYRGAKKANDLEGAGNRSLSFGTGLFAGGVYDGTASAFHYMRQSRNDAYAIAIPAENLPDSPFYTPSTHGLSQMLCYGEFFHSRTQVCPSAVQTVSYSPFPSIEGVVIQFKRTPEDEVKIPKKYGKLISDQSGEEIASQFARYVRQAIDLKADIATIHKLHEQSVSGCVGQPLNLRPVCIAQLIQVELLRRRQGLAQIQGASLPYSRFFM